MTSPGCRPGHYLAAARGTRLACAQYLSRLRHWVLVTQSLHLWCLTHRLVLVLVRLLGAPPTGGTHSSQTHLLARATALRSHSLSFRQPLPLRTAGSLWPVMKTFMSSSVVSTHAFFYTIACAPPCGDTVITPLLAVPAALCCLVVGALGRILHLRLRARSSMR